MSILNVVLFCADDGFKNKYLLFILSFGKSITKAEKYSNRIFLLLSLDKDKWGNCG